MPGNRNKYVIEYLSVVVKEHIPDLDASSRKRIISAITDRLMVDPVSYGKPLRYSLKGHRRLRVGDYRIVYRINENTVIIVAIRHRKDIYEE